MHTISVTVLLHAAGVPQRVMLYGGVQEIENHRAQQLPTLPRQAPLLIGMGQPGRDIMTCRAGVLVMTRTSCLLAARGIALLGASGIDKLIAHTEANDTEQDNV